MLPGGQCPPDPPTGPLARSGGDLFLDALFRTCFFYFFLGVYTPWEAPLVFVLKFNVESIKNRVWGPLGITIFVKTYIHVKVELGDNHG